MYPGTHAASDPTRSAVVMAGSGEVLTYGELEEGSRRLAQVLTAAGLRRGEVVGLLTDNRPEAFVVYWAALRSGLYITLLNHHLDAAEVGYILRDAGVRALVVSAGKSELATAVRDEADVAVALAYGGPVAGYDDWDAALAAADPELLPDQPCGSMMLYSSGTTGRPKGVRPPLPQRQVHEAGDPLVALNHDVYGVDSATVYLSPAPIYHSAPVKWCHSVHAHGGTVVMMERFDAEGALRAIDEYKVTHAQFVPTMLIRILTLDAEVRRRYDTSSLRVAVHAAAPCPVDLKKAIIAEWGPIVWEYYGQTESLGVTIIDSAQALAHPGSVGRPVLGTLHVCDDDGSEVLVGEVGTVYFERDALPFGYHNDDERTKAARHPGHPTWGTVGDLGYVDDEGFLYLTDRKAFMIISGGVNIYPQEVENALALHPKVHDVAVIGVPDAEMGESVAAFVELPAGVQPSPELTGELIAFVRSRVARFKAPRTITFVEALPRTPTGKLVKGRLRDYGTESTVSAQGEDRPMSPVAFGTLSFYEALAENLNADPVWAEKGQALSFTIVYSYGPPLEADFLMAFESGKIIEVREANDADIENTEYVISGSSDTWRKLIDGELKPTMALATGKFKVKGDVKALLKNMAAMNYLLDTLTKIPIA